MIDVTDRRISQQLSEHHLYPFSRNIYESIFKSFSHFPVHLKDIGFEGEGKTITVMAWAVSLALKSDTDSFEDLNSEIYQQIKRKIPPYFPQDPVIDVFIGSLLFHYHPAQVKNAVSLIDAAKRFDSRQVYEFELKKRTLYIYIV